MPAFFPGLARAFSPAILVYLKSLLHEFYENFERRIIHVYPELESRLQFL